MLGESVAMNNGFSLRESLFMFLEIGIQDGDHHAGPEPGRLCLHLGRTAGGWRWRKGRMADTVEVTAPPRYLPPSPNSSPA